MSRPATTSGPRKTIRKTIDVRRSSGTRTITKTELDSSCYRLSKTPQKYQAKIAQVEKQDPFSVRYFNDHPDEIDDIHTPKEKLKVLEEELSGDLEDSKKFNLLMKQKSLRYIAYGEVSIEALDSHTKLGEFYNQTDKPKSAIRHFDKANSLEQNFDLDITQQARIAVGRAESYIMLSIDSKKAVSSAASSLRPVVDAEIPDEKLTFRRDLVSARIQNAKGNYHDAFHLYLTAEKSMESCGWKREDANTADILTEIGECGRFAKEYQESVRAYQDAYKIYESLNMEQEMNEIEPYCHLPEEEEEEEEPKIIEKEVHMEEEENILEVAVAEIKMGAEANLDDDKNVKSDKDDDKSVKNSNEKLTSSEDENNKKADDDKITSSEAPPSPKNINVEPVTETETENANSSSQSEEESEEESSSEESEHETTENEQETTSTEKTYETDENSEDFVSEDSDKKKKGSLLSAQMEEVASALDDSDSN